MNETIVTYKNNGNREYIDKSSFVSFHIQDTASIEVLQTMVSSVKHLQINRISINTFSHSYTFTNAFSIIHKGLNYKV